MLRITKLLVMCLLFVSTPGFGSDQNSRLLYINGVITSRSLSPVSAALDEVIQSDDTSPVRIVLNSPGGAVIPGMMFISKMRAVRDLGIRIECYVLDVAASMAFQILTECDSRSALNTSFLLWHPVRVGVMGVVTASTAAELQEDLSAMDKFIMRQLDTKLSMPDEEIRRHFHRETLWIGAQLAEQDPRFLSTRNSFPLLVRELATATTTEQAGFFDLIREHKDDLIYIWNGKGGMGK